MRGIFLKPVARVDGAVTASRTIKLKEVINGVFFGAGKPFIVGTRAELEAGTAEFVVMQNISEGEQGDAYLKLQTEEYYTLADDDIVCEVVSLPLQKDLIEYISFHYPLY